MTLQLPFPRHALLACVFVILEAGIVAGQEKPATVAPTTPAPGVGAANSAAAKPAAEAETVVEPDTYLLPDQQGKLQPVLNFPFEEFIEALKIKKRIDGPEMPPRYSLQNLSVAGKAGTDFATLQVELTVQLLYHDWIRVPLGMSEAILREPVSHQGAGEHFSAFDERGGYVCWLRGKKGDTHKLVLSVLVPLTKLGGETALRLAAPRATTSQFSVEVALPTAVGRVSDNSSITETKQPSPTSTHFTGVGVRGAFELVWRSADRPAATLPTVLESTGAILARIDGRSVRCETQLTVRSFGGQFEQFQVVLPPGAELIAGNQPGYSVTAATTPPTEPGETAERRLVTVKLDQKTTGPVDVRLVTEQSSALAVESRTVELAGFEVVGAVRQWGHIAVEVLGDWQVLWGQRRNVRQVADLPSVLRREGLAAGFEYFSQPCSLMARVAPRTTHVQVEPEYVLLLGARRAQLQARLQYTVRGAKEFSFDIDVPGWDVETVGPATLVDVDKVVIGQDGLCKVQLLQPTTGQIELVLTAWRELDESAEFISLPLPAPRATSQTPSTLIVVADDNVELTPMPGETRGLTPLQVAPNVALPPRQKEPLYFRGEGLSTVFATTLRVHPQTVATSVSSQVEIDQGNFQVTQKLAYDVSYEPLDKLTLEVPTALVAAGKLDATIDGQKLTLVNVADDDAATNPAGTVRVRAALPQARIGRFEMLLRFQQDSEKLLPQQSVLLTVPLAMPAEWPPQKNEAFIKSSPRIKVSPRAGDWSDASAERKPANGDLRLTSKGATAQLPLGLRLDEQYAPGSTVVDRAWIQTWLTTGARQDRVVYRFTGSDSQLEFALPAGVDAAGLELILDGQLTAPEFSSDGKLIVALSTTAQRRDHQLELRYHFQQRDPRFGRLELTAPQLQRGVWIRRVYWQLVLPPDEHIVSPPDDYTSEFTWGWCGFFWGRRPLLDQGQLETWSGATAGAEAPRSSNRYLLSSLGTPQRIELHSVSRSLIVLLASGIVLVVGLLLIYVRHCRHPGVVFVAAVALLGIGMLYPEPGLLAAQAAVLGLVLVMVAGVLKHFLIRPPRRAVTVGGGSSLVVGSRNSTESYLRGSLPSTGSSAATTIALHPSESSG